MLRFMRDITPIATPDDTVPGRLVLFVELFLDVSSYVLQSEREKKEKEDTPTIQY